nr:hypothetical protein [uncultured bacterium]
MLGLDRVVARYIWTAVCIVLLLAIVYAIRRTLFVFIIALLFAYLLWPLVNFLDRRLPGRSRVPALAIVYILLVGLLVVLGTAIGTRVASEATTFGTKIPELIAKLKQSSEPIASSSVPSLKTRALSILREQIDSHSSELMSQVPKIALGVLAHVEIILFIILVPILGFFFLKDGRSILADILGLVADGPQRAKAEEILADIHILLAQYIRALVLLSLATFAAYTSFLTLIGTPYAVLLGAIAAPLEFIPMVGPFTAAVIVLLVAGVSGFPHLVWILIFLIAYRLFQDYVLQPMLLGAGVELHPLLIIFGVMAGGQIAGIAGSFLSVLILATLRIVYRQLRFRPLPGKY